MPKYQLSIGAIILSLLVLPAITRAAYDDVTLTTDTVITVGSINLSVSGSSATIESIVVESNHFTASLAGTSTIKVTSSNGYTLNTTAATSYISRTCSGGVSTLTLSIPVGSPNSGVSMDVTPVASACTAVVSTNGGSTGGGAASSGGAPSSPVLAITPAVTSIPAVSAIVPATISAIVLTKDLSRGAEGADVMSLQKFLASDKTLYPEGVINGFFGPATERAVKRFQAKYGISQLGRVGPATRAKLTEVSKVVCPAGVTCTPVAATVIPVTPIATTTTTVNTSVKGIVFTTLLSRGSSNDDVVNLQKILNSDPDTTIAVSGAGSPGNETNLYGSMTEKAVGKFQVKYGIATPGERGYGTVGPKTRAKLNELSK